MYFLKNPGTGNTPFQDVSALSTAVPDSAALPNYDTSYDAVPGLRLLPTSSGSGETDPTMRHAFVLNTKARTLTGTAKVAVWAALDESGTGSATLHAALFDCTASIRGCVTIGERTAEIEAPLSKGFEPATFVFDGLNHSFGSDRRLALILFAEGGRTAHIGYDADHTPSFVALILE